MLSSFTMLRNSLVRFCCSLVVLAQMSSAFAQDVVELTTGAKIRGRVVSSDDNKVVVEVIVNGKPFARTYTAKQIRNLEINGSKVELSANDAPVVRSKTEIQTLITREGKTLPDWFEATKLSYPPTLDLNWPQPAPKGWDNSRNVGQFIWDRINPNPGQWRSGVKLMHYIMENKKDDKEIVQRAMLALGSMYHHLHVDYPRAAYWLQRAGVEKDPDEHPQASLQLADSYFHLGSKPMAMAILQRLKRSPPSVIKLFGDLGETKIALSLAERFSKTTSPVVCYLYAGDVCRVASQLDDAEVYYRKALAAADKDTRNNDHAKRDRKRAEASLAAIAFYKINPKELKDGEYKASSIGYEDDVAVSVTIYQGRIESVKVTDHREKQFYSSISDTPPRIIAKQGIRNVDAVAGATITSEAIINATAKALALGRP